MEKDGVKMRCLVCGRVVAGSEARLSAETGDCEGCQAEFKAALQAITPEVPARRDADGNLIAAIPAHNTYTAEQALALARANHSAREQAKFDALQAKGQAAIASGGKKVADDWAKAVLP